MDQLVTKGDLRSKARTLAVQFLYQCECERIYYFSEGSLGSFLENFEVKGELTKDVRTLTQGVFKRLNEIDQAISQVATHWSLDRLAATDRSILRIAVFEFLALDTPNKVLLNEAINLGKTFGTEKSGSFINGVLDAIIKSHKN